MERLIQSSVGEAGFSLSEMVVAVGIVSVLSGMAVFQIGKTRPAAAGDGAMRVVLSQMTAARERAITERRNMRLTFENNAVTTLREEYPGPQVSTLSVVPFEGKAQYLQLGVGDTPDGFVKPTGSTSAVNFPTAPPPAGGGPPEVKFTPDGTFVNQDGLTLNGTIFIGLPSETLSARAVTIFGSTGRIRGYRYNGKAWKPI